MPILAELLIKAHFYNLVQYLIQASIPAKTTPFSLNSVYKNHTLLEPINYTIFAPLNLNDVMQSRWFIWYNLNEQKVQSVIRNSFLLYTTL